MTDAPNFERSDEDCRQFLSAELPHYHKIRLNKNITTPGRVDRNQEFAHLKIPEAFFQGKRVLDIGGLDGVLAFNAEAAGAKDNLVIDVEDFEDYDWGWAGPTKEHTGQGETKNRVFPALKTFFNSSTERKKKTVYDLDVTEDGLFDAVFFYGVLYHLRHPLLSFDSIRKVCREVVFVETHVCNHQPMVPSSLFYLDDVLSNASTNWTGPSESCVVHWMRDAGFETVYAEQKFRVPTRQRFVGFTGDVTFVPGNNFRLCDADYFRDTRNAVERLLAINARGHSMLAKAMGVFGGKRGA